MKFPLCNIDDVPNEGTKFTQFFGREVNTHKVNGLPKAAISICIHPDVLINTARRQRAELCVG